MILLVQATYINDGVDFKRTIKITGFGKIHLINQKSRITTIGDIYTAINQANLSYNDRNMLLNIIAPYQDKLCRFFDDNAYDKDKINIKIKEIIGKPQIKSIKLE